MNTLAITLTSVINNLIEPKASLYSDVCIKNIISNIIKFIRDDNSIKLHTPTRINTSFVELSGTYATISIHYNNEKTSIVIVLEETTNDKIDRVKTVNVIENKEDILDIESLLK